MTTPQPVQPAHADSSGRAAIVLSDLTLAYSSTLAVDGLSLEVPVGSIYGLLGPNGAGKTTTIKALLGLRRPVSGQVRVLGLDPQQQGSELRARIGYVSEEAGLYERLSVQQMGEFYRSTARTWQPATFERFLTEFGLSPRTRIRALSRGMKMQLAFALAMSGDPEVLILDEPTAGLDPLARHALLGSLVREVAASGITVVFSSHNLAEVEAVADSVGILRAGKLLYSGELDDLRQHRKVLRLTYDAAPAAAQLASLSRLPGVRQLEEEGQTVRLSVSGDVPALTRAIRLQAGGLRDLESVDQSLEELFLDLMKEQQ